MEKNTRDKIVFGRLLRKLRTKANKTQELLAFEMGVERTYISMLERGVNGPSLSSLLLLCKAMDLKFSEFAVLFENELSAKDR